MCAHGYFSASIFLSELEESQRRTQVYLVQGPPHFVEAEGGMPEKPRPSSPPDIMLSYCHRRLFKRRDRGLRLVNPIPPNRRDHFYTKQIYPVVPKHHPSRCPGIRKLGCSPRLVPI